MNLFLKRWYSSKLENNFYIFKNIKYVCLFYFLLFLTDENIRVLNWCENNLQVFNAVYIFEISNTVYYLKIIYELTIKVIVFT